MSMSSSAKSTLIRMFTTRSNLALLIRSVAAYVKLTLYGVGKNCIVRCILIEYAKWNDEDVVKHRMGNAIDNLRHWIQEARKKMEGIAKELKATPGRYDIFARYAFWRQN